ncbi:MAG TPA: hypothetical protein ENI27_04335 [bacterium]|nr:hypothetical protein [bacterium]
MTEKCGCGKALCPAPAANAMVFGELKSACNIHRQIVEGQPHHTDGTVICSADFWVTIAKQKDHDERPSWISQFPGHFRDAKIAGDCGNCENRKTTFDGNDNAFIFCKLDERILVKGDDGYHWLNREGLRPGRCKLNDVTDPVALCVVSHRKPETDFDDEHYRLGRH